MLWLRWHHPQHSSPASAGHPCSKNTSQSQGDRLFRPQNTLHAASRCLLSAFPTKPVRCKNPVQEVHTLTCQLLLLPPLVCAPFNQLMYAHQLAE
jgi:hypothetical protein